MRMPVEQRRDLLLDSAFRVIARHGVDGATTRAICGEAGVTLSTFHYVFASREVFLAALVQHGIEVELEAVATALAEGADDHAQGREGARTILLSALIAYIDSIVADPDREQAMISLNQYARQTEGLRPLGAEMYHRYYAAIAEALAASAELAGVAWDCPVIDLAPLVIAATDGITLAYLNIRNHLVCESIAEATVTMLMTHVVECPEATDEPG